MITNKELKEVISETYKMVSEKYVVNNQSVEETFLNLKAHIQAQESTEKFIKEVNEQLKDNGNAHLRLTKTEDEVIAQVFPDGPKNYISKHFDFSIDDLFYTAIDFFTQAYEEEGFTATSSFSREENGVAEIHISL